MAPNHPKSNLIQSYASAMVAGMIAKVEASMHLAHRLTKGELRELFLCDLLNPFLTAQFDIGTGIIINQRGDQSRQTDIIIYDTRILPPFIQERHLGVYPAESVVATIEVKSTLTKQELMKAEQSARRLHEKVYAKDAGIYHDYDSTVVFWRVPNELVYRHGSLLLGKQIGKDIFHPLPELEALVRIQDQRLHKCLGLLTTRFPDGFEGQAAFGQ